MAAIIRDETGLDAELVEGSRGEFTVWVGDERVAQKDARDFPSEPDVLSAVQKALARG